MVFLIIVLVILGVIIVALQSSLDNDYERMKKEHGQAYADMVKKEAQERAAYGKGYGIKCPNCGQVNVKTIINNLCYEDLAGVLGHM